MSCGADGLVIVWKVRISLLGSCMRCIWAVCVQYWCLITLNVFLFCFFYVCVEVNRLLLCRCFIQLTVGCAGR